MRVEVEKVSGRLNTSGAEKGKNMYGCSIQQAIAAEFAGTKELELPLMALVPPLGAMLMLAGCAAGVDSTSASR